MPNAPEGDTSTGTEGTEKPLTLADLKAFLQEELPKSVNAAVSSHTKRLTKSFDEKLAKLTPAAKADEDSDDEPTVDPKASPPATAKPAAAPVEAPKGPDPALLALQRQIAALTAKSEAAEKARAAAERARIVERGHGSIRSALAGKVAPGAEDHVLDLLRARERIVIGDDGSVRLRGISKDEPEDGHDLEGGIAAFIKSDEAKFFVPPPNAGPANAKRSQSFGAQAPGANGSSPRDAVDAFEAKHGPLSKSLI